MQETGISWHAIALEKATMNAVIESFSGTLSDAHLFVNPFGSLKDARSRREEWQGSITH